MEYIFAAFSIGYGATMLIKPEWMMAYHRWHKAAGTTNSPEDIEPSEAVHKANFGFGVVFILIGLAFLFINL